MEYNLTIPSAKWELSQNVQSTYMFAGCRFSFFFVLDDKDNINFLADVFWTSTCKSFVIEKQKTWRSYF